MQFLFSSPIGRLTFIGRLVPTAFILGLLSTHIIANMSNPAQSILDAVFSPLICLALIIYQIRWLILARFESIGISFWWIFLLLIPILGGAIQAIVDATPSLAWISDIPWGFIAGGIFLFFLVLLMILPEEAFHKGDVLQAILYDYEVGEGRVVVRLVPLIVVLMIMGAVYNFVVFHGLDDTQSMDNAQLARQIVSGQGYTTRFLRPQAVMDLRNHAVKRSLVTGASPELFPRDQFLPGVPRILPDTYNAPGYPVLLASWFYLVRPHFDQKISPRLDGFSDPVSGKVSPVYSGDRWIPPFNLIFVLLTGILVFFLGLRLFDERAAWLAVVAFFLTNLVWQLSLTALSTSFLMFLVTALIFCAVEIYCVSEACFQSEEASFGPAWAWGILLSVLLAAACLTRLPLLVLLVPLVIMLVVMPKPSWLLFVVIALISCVAIAPWLWHLYKVSGHPLGSNTVYLIYGAEGYKGDQIFRGPSIPGYERLFRNLSQKEMDGFLWHFEHGWSLLGSNPMVILFFASLLHAYKRRRARMLQWFLIGTAVALIAVNNFGVAQPETLGAWNVLVLLLPVMIVMGSAFFFIQLDRLGLQVSILNNIIVIFLLALTGAPVALSLTSPPSLYAFPPYIPPLIKVLSEYSQPDEWVTNDMPWASAWYANRPSLWVPDSVAEFSTLHDNICPTGMLFFTPETWMKPGSTILTGEDREWFPFIASVYLPPKSDGQSSVSIPPNFPLSAHALTPGGTDYVIWSDRPRWQSR